MQRWAFGLSMNTSTDRLSAETRGPHARTACGTSSPLRVPTDAAGSDSIKTF
jgi:hypothetical protein